MPAAAPGGSLADVERARLAARDLDEESSAWLRCLDAGGPERQAAERDRHARLPALDAGQWERLPDRFGIDPARHAEAAGILTEVRRVVDEELTAHQRRVFTAIVVDEIPLDAVAAWLGPRRNAVYKVIFDPRHKIRRALVASGYPEDAGRERQ